MNLSIEVNSSLFLYFAVLAYIVTGVTCAFFKWRHVCLPYKGMESLYFPNRGQWIFVLSSSFALIGCIVDPANIENWVMARCFVLLATPSFIISGVIKHCTSRAKRTVTYTLLYNIPNFFAILLCILGWFHTGLLWSYRYSVYTIACTFGFCFTFGVIPLLFWIKRQQRFYYENMYSNEEEFPSNYATKYIPKILIYTPIPWVCFCSSNHIVTGIGYLCVAVAHVLFLVWSLDAHVEVKPLVEHPDSNSFGRPDYEENDTEINHTFAVDDESYKQLYEDLKQFMLTEKPYLNSDLTIVDLARMFKCGVPALRLVSKVYYGSFIKMVNTYRLEEAKRLTKLHPEYSKQAIAEESGFGSYRSYLRAEQSEVENN